MPDKTATKIHSEGNGTTTRVKSRDFIPKAPANFNPKDSACRDPFTVASCYNLNQVQFLHKGNNITPNRFQFHAAARKQNDQEAMDF